MTHFLIVFSPEMFQNLLFLCEETKFFVPREGPKIFFVPKVGLCCPEGGKDCFCPSGGKYFFVPREVKIVFVPREGKIFFVLRTKKIFPSLWTKTIFTSLWTKKIFTSLWTKTIFPSLRTTKPNLRDKKNLWPLPRDKKTLFHPEKKKILKHFWAENNEKMSHWALAGKKTKSATLNKKSQKKNVHFFILSLQLFLLF